MDNDRKITDLKVTEKVTDLSEQSRSLFLNESVEDSEEKSSQYDLALEFANSRKNRSPLVPGIIAAVVIVVGAGMWFVTSRIQENSQNIVLNIAEFQDVNLREVLDTAKRIDMQITKAIQSKVILINERDSKIEAIRTNAAQQISILPIEDLSADEILVNTTDINQKANVDVYRINEKYAGEIDLIDQQIQVFQARMSRYDIRQIEEAQKQEEIFNSQRVAFDLQNQQQKDFYEDRIDILINEFNEKRAAEKRFHENFVDGLKKKYDPTFTESEIDALLLVAIDGETQLEFALSEYSQDPVLGKDSAVSDGEYALIQKRLAEYRAIIGRLQALPHEHSVEAAIDQLDYRSRQIVGKLDAMWGDLMASSVDVSHFTYAMESLIWSNRENGYIIDPRDDDNIAVYMDKIREITDGGTGYVFRKDSEFIATVRFHVAKGSVSASIIELAEGKKLMPFDKILIQVSP